MRFVFLWSVLIVGLVLGARGITLAARRISPDGLYGFRTTKTIGNSGIWCSASYEWSVYDLRWCSDAGRYCRSI